MWRIRARLNEIWCEKENERSVRQKRILTENDDEEDWIEIRKVDEKDGRARSAQLSQNRLQSLKTSSQFSFDIREKAEPNSQSIQRSRGILKESICDTPMLPSYAPNNTESVIQKSLNTTTDTIYDSHVRESITVNSFSPHYGIALSPPASDIAQLRVCILSGNNTDDCVIEVECNWTLSMLRRHIASFLHENPNLLDIHIQIDGHKIDESITAASLCGLGAGAVHAHVITGELKEGVA